MLIDPIVADILFAGLFSVSCVLALLGGVSVYAMAADIIRGH